MNGKILTVIKRIPGEIKKHWKNIIGLILSSFLLWAGLWQSEIVDICIWDHRNFDFPFYILRDINIWVARDLFMTVIVIAFVIQFISLWKWEE